MRLARRFRPITSNKTTRANSKKQAKRIAENYSVIRAMEEAASKSKK